ASLKASAAREHAPSCSFCGGPPWIACRRPIAGADGAERIVSCAWCGLEWPMRRIECAACGESDPEKLQNYESEPHRGVRIEACERCHAYIKSIDLAADARPIPEVDDLVSLSMDLWAQESGFARIEPGLAGI